MTSSPKSGLPRFKATNAGNAYTYASSPNVSPKATSKPQASRLPTKTFVNRSPSTNGADKFNSVTVSSSSRFGRGREDSVFEIETPTPAPTAPLPEQPSYPLSDPQRAPTSADFGFLAPTSAADYATTRPLNLKMGSRDPSPHLPSDPFASSGPSHTGITAATGISKEDRVPPPTMHAGAATNTATVSPNVQGEQETRTALLDSLIASFGQSILEGVDVEAIVQQRPPRSSIEPKKSVTYVSFFGRQCSANLTI